MNNNTIFHDWSEEDVIKTIKVFKGIPGFKELSDKEIITMFFVKLCDLENRIEKLEGIDK